MLEEPPGHLVVTKKAAAMRQIDAAIAAFWRGDYDVAITLALAAEGMADPSDDSIFARQVAGMPPYISKKAWISAINSERDWLKHPTNGIHGDEITIELGDAGHAIVRALHRWPEWTPPMSEFKIWYWKHLHKETRS